MFTKYGSVGNARRTSIADAKRRRLPAARRSVANANGLKNEKISKPVNVTGKPNTSQINTDLELELEGCHHILPRVTSQDRARHIRHQGNSQDKDPFPLTKVEGLFLASDRFLLTREAVSSHTNPA